MTVRDIEDKNNRLATSYFESAIDYKLKWGAELERRKVLNLDLPDPVPHPDDIILDARHGTAQIKGPMTQDEKNLWAFGADYLEDLAREIKSKERWIKRNPNHPDVLRIRQEIEHQRQQHAKLNEVVGPVHMRSMEHMLREYQRLKGLET